MKRSVLAWTTVVFVGAMGPTTAFAFAPAAPSSVERRGAPAPADSASTPPAPASVKAEVLVLYGSNDGSGIDKGIGDLPELAKPPFSAYNSYKLVDRSQVDLAQGKGSDKGLPDGTTLTLTYNGLADTKSNDKSDLRFSVTESIQRADGTSVLPALQSTAKRGKYLFVVSSQKYKDGVLAIGVRVL